METEAGSHTQHSARGMGVVRASLMLLSTKPKVISEAIGHSSVAFTLDVYSHIIEGMQSEAMSLLDEVLPPAVKGARKNNGNSMAKVAVALSRN